MKEYKINLSLWLAAIAIAVTMLLGISENTFAAPQYMSDGQVFDAELYATLYPDVAAVYGTDATKLYSHYKKYGKNEGRLPYLPIYGDNTASTATNTAAASTTTTTAAASTIVATSEQQQVINSLIAYLNNPVQDPVTKARMFYVNTSFSPVSAEFESTIVSALRNAGYTLTPASRVVNGVRYDGVVYSVTIYKINGKGLRGTSTISLHDDPSRKEVACDVYLN